MTERKTSYLEGSTPDDHFADTDDVLLGATGTFTVCAMARAFPGFGTGGPGTAAPVGFGINNQEPLTPETGGYNMQASFSGFVALAWGDGAVQNQIVAGGSAILGGGAEGATTILHAIFDANADTVGLWFNGTFWDSVGGAGFVARPASTPTTVGTISPDPGLPLDGRIGMAGVAIVDAVLTPQQIADHYDACIRNDQMFNTGVWDALWDVRAGLPTLDNDTTEWLDEVGAAPLDRNTTNENFSMSIAAHKPRFQ